MLLVALDAAISAVAADHLLPHDTSLRRIGPCACCSVRFCIHAFWDHAIVIIIAELGCCDESQNDLADDSGQADQCQIHRRRFVLAQARQECDQSEPDEHQHARHDLLVGAVVILKSAASEIVLDAAVGEDHGIHAQPHQRHAAAEQMRDALLPFVGGVLGRRIAACQKARQYSSEQRSSLAVVAFVCEFVQNHLVRRAQNDQCRRVQLHQHRKCDPGLLGASHGMGICLVRLRSKMQIFQHGDGNDAAEEGLVVVR
mmetsp:Transcript_8765/g.25206  ORF Transcript_8765/g.25206 Transcript_8765/m.25206 type:complete len:257 (-) Transcript_8765:1170-1940(-)